MVDKKPTRRLSQNEVETLLDMSKNGHNAVTIATKLNTSVGTVRNWKKKLVENGLLEKGVASTNDIVRALREKRGLPTQTEEAE